MEIEKRKLKKLGQAIREYKEEKRRKKKEEREGSTRFRQLIKHFYIDEAEEGSDHEENDDVVKEINVVLSQLLRSNQ